MALASQIVAVILDMDGTLLDTEAPARAAFDAALMRQGFHPSLAGSARMIGRSTRERLPILRATFGARFDAARFLADYYADRDGRFAAGIPHKPGARAMLDALVNRDVPRALVTAASRATAEHRLRRSGLRGLLGPVVTRDDVVAGKPEPDGFLLGASLLGVAPSACVAIEDSPAGVQAAHAAGMVTVMVPDLVPAGDAETHACAAVLEDLHEVRRWLAARLPFNVRCAPALAATLQDSPRSRNGEAIRTV